MEAELEKVENYNPIKHSSELKAIYLNQIVPQLINEFNYTSKMAVPKLEKIVINIGLGEAITNKNVINEAIEELKSITNQKPLITYAKKSIASFKLREKMPIGVKVTLRKDQMYYFLDKLINIALPRVRDFRGLSTKSFDGFGNYTFGIKELLIFPEIEFDKVKVMKGMDVSIITSANTNQEGFALLKAIGIPFVKNS